MEGAVLAGKGSLVCHAHGMILLAGGALYVAGGAAASWGSEPH
ncbi:MAG: hypothetical protein QOJ15_9633 [Bradyrhizobium sp.]|jgi:hypothetical protein|nr:hypothetical protein [Bradyrhizobium sp.]